MSNSQNAMCPHCGQRAPIRLRGINAFCTVCNGKRLPFTAKTLNLAGTPYKVGGIAARIAGWVGFGIGTVASVSVGGIIALLGTWLADSSWPGIAIGTVMWLATIAFSLTAIIGGRKLGERGATKAFAAKLETVRALANHQGGRVTAAEVAQSLAVTEVQADAMLTELAKDPEGDVTLDLDDHGNIHYLFGVGSDALNDPRWRIVEQKAEARIATDEAAEAEAAAAEAADAVANQRVRRS
jgi:hypothetical protein